MGEVELVSCVHHQSVELVALALELSPVLLLLWFVELEGRNFFHSGKKLRIEAECHIVHGVDHVQAEVTSVVVALAQYHALTVGEVA